MKNYDFCRLGLGTIGDFSSEQLLKTIVSPMPELVRRHEIDRFWERRVVVEIIIDSSISEKAHGRVCNLNRGAFKIKALKKH